MKKHFSIQVYGKVQGVWFRGETQERARKLDITGYVCNRSDGSVLIHAEGEEKNLEKFVAWCHEGPSMAEVEKVLIKEHPSAHFETFQIRHEEG